MVISDNEAGDGLALAEMIFRSRYDAEFADALIVALSRFIVQHLHPDDALTISVRQTVAKMENRFHDPALDVAALLRESGYAEDYIRAGFKRVMGMTPMAFLTQMRIRHACYLIDTFRNTLPLSEIGERCGYVDYVQFSKKFRAVMGISPRVYQKAL
ncbi:MAG: helix-turn-helix transcriptional regulator [Oscillospiraceae bacterium]|nr:helix-turn-helix transcriptional regulator [Oscillospiraceae bacterium]